MQFYAIFLPFLYVFFPLFCALTFATLCFISVVFNVIFLAPFYEFAASAAGEHEYVNMIGEYICECVYICTYICMSVCLPHNCFSCAFSRIHCTLIQSNMHLAQLLIHSCLHLRFDRFLSLWIGFFHSCPSSRPKFALSLSFFHFAHQSAFPLCNFWLTGNSYKRPHQVGIPTLSGISSFHFLSLSDPFEFPFDHNCKEDVSVGHGKGRKLLYASFKVTKWWFIEGLDGKTNRNSLNFTWLNDLHKFFISFTQLQWHFVKARERERV